MLYRAYNIIIDCSVGGLGHSRYVVNGINYVNIFINVNGKVSISWKRGLWQSYGNSNINPYRIHKYSKRIKYFQMDHVKMILLIKVSIENGMVNGSRLILSIVAKSRSVWIMKMLKCLSWSHPRTEARWHNNFPNPIACISVVNLIRASFRFF